MVMDNLGVWGQSEGSGWVAFFLLSCSDTDQARSRTFEEDLRGSAVVALNKKETFLFPELRSI